MTPDVAWQVGTLGHTEIASDVFAITYAAQACMPRLADMQAVLAAWRWLVALLVAPFLGLWLHLPRLAR